MGLISTPAGAIDYLKFPVTLAGQRFVEATNFRCLFGLEETFQSLRR
jgi:hypothetical protein